MRSALVAALVAGTALAPAAAAPAAAPAAGAINVLAELSAIAKRPRPRPAGERGETKACVVPTEAERAEIQQRVVAWIDQQFPDERPDEDQGERGLVFSPGCKQGKGMLLSVSQDRISKKTVDTSRVRRNFVLRVEGTRIDSIAARTSTASFNWSEWADEGGLVAYGFVDLDGDGTDDPVWSDLRHDGGSRWTSEALSVRFATGRIAPIATVQNLAAFRVIKGQLVIAGQRGDDPREIYGCVGKDLLVAPCAASARLQRVADQFAAATALTELHEAPDRDLAVEWLGTLGAKAPPELLAALPATTAVQKAERHVARFLASKQIDGAFEAVFEQPHPEAAAYFGQVASELGDRPCVPSPLSAATRKKLEAWGARQDRAPQWRVEIAPACGAYAWVRWPRRSDGQMVESLIGLDGPEPVEVATLEKETVNEEVTGTNGVIDPGYGSSFFQHGATTVAFVIRNHDLLVIANDKIVARRQGDFARFAYRPWWHEVSADLVLAGDEILHPTPAGLETIDRPAVKQRAALRTALGRVTRWYPSSASEYLAALRTLGADGTLIAEYQALPP